MKIIAGKWRGRPLISPTEAHVRPTSARGREALFNALTARTSFTGLKVADLFCGTGALGLEALSRGASHALLVDLDTHTATANAQALGASAGVTLLKADASTCTHPNLATANLIFMDPPYGQGLAEKTLAHITPFLQPGTLIVVEAETPLQPPQALQLIKQAKYGKAFIQFFKREG